MHGQHHPVLREESVRALAPRFDGVYVDGTFGRGGHTGRLLECLGPEGRVLAFDRDERAIETGKAWVDERLTLFHARFSEMENTLRPLGITQVDGILLDLGVSSPQLDRADRGFSFRQDGPLDMRMDQTRGMTAAEWLAGASEAELAEVIHTLGEERFARQVARAIVQQRQETPLLTTRQLAHLVGRVVRTREPGQDPATRTFQAIRLHINGELDELSRVLPQALRLLCAGGRLVVISFHSLEDRMVKQFLRQQSQPPDVPRGLAVREADRPLPKLVTRGKAVRASVEEVRANPRSRSAVMRVAERTAA